MDKLPKICPECFAPEIQREKPKTRPMKLPGRVVYACKRMMWTNGDVYVPPDSTCLSRRARLQGRALPLAADDALEVERTPENVRKAADDYLILAAEEVEGEVKPNEQ